MYMDWDQKSAFFVRPIRATGVPVEERMFHATAR